MTKDDRDLLDAAVLGVVTRGRLGDALVAFSDIMAATSGVRARTYRDIDRSLQRLRAAGKIRFRKGSGAGWTRVQP